MNKREANAAMRKKYPNRDWWDVPGAKAERDALMQGKVPKKPVTKPIKVVTLGTSRGKIQRQQILAKTIAAAPHKPATSASSFSGVMLAKKWKNQDPTGWHMSEKLDGMRAYWTGSKLVTRNNKPINAPAWFLSSLPRGVALDGELWLGRGQFQSLISIVRRDVPDARWRSVTYLVFEAPSLSGSFEARQAQLKQIAVKAGNHVHYVAQTECRGKAHLDQFHTQVKKQGGEGVMLRAPGSPYVAKRSSDLLKVKGHMDAEARITGYEPGKGKHTGRLGAYKAVLLGNKRISFKIGTGLSDWDRENPLPIGSVVTVRFTEKTDAGKPRFPRFISARDYE